MAQWLVLAASLRLWWRARLEKKIIGARKWPLTLGLFTPRLALLLNTRWSNKGDLQHNTHKRETKLMSSHLQASWYDTHLNENACQRQGRAATHARGYLDWVWFLSHARCSSGQQSGISESGCHHGQWMNDEGPAGSLMLNLLSPCWGNCQTWSNVTAPYCAHCYTWWQILETNPALTHAALMLIRLACSSAALTVVSTLFLVFAGRGGAEESVQLQKRRQRWRQRRQRQWLVLAASLCRRTTWQVCAESG